MYNLDDIDINKINFNGIVSEYNGEMDPIYDLPLASLANSNGFKIDNDGNIILLFNVNQYLYDLLDKLATTIAKNINQPIEIPINYTSNYCKWKINTINPRIPVYLTTTNKGFNKCYLNINSELKEFLTDGLGFKLQIKIRRVGQMVLFFLESIQIPDMFDGEQDYLDPNLDFEDENEVDSDDDYLNSDDFYIDIDDLDQSDEELITVTL